MGASSLCSSVATDTGSTVLSVHYSEDYCAPPYSGGALSDAAIHPSVCFLPPAQNGAF